MAVLDDIIYDSRDDPHEGQNLNFTGGGIYVANSNPILDNLSLIESEVL